MAGNSWIDVSWMREMWMIRTPGGRHADEILRREIIGLGWSEVPSLQSARTPEDFYAAIKQAYPDYKGQQIINAGRQLYKFFREIKIGDTVATYDSPSRTYHVGVVEGEAKSDPDLPEYISNFRKVNWLHRIDRDALSLPTRNSLGSTLTLFKPSEEASRELQRLIDSPAAAIVSEAAEIAETEAEDPLASALQNSRELIKDKIMKLSWQDMQGLVAGILRAMGYKTTVSPDGSDRGKDIIASPDGLGLEQPRIFVEVKHRKTQQMGAPEIRRFIGGRNDQNDRCPYVSTGGFTTEARYEAERSKVPLTLIDSDLLVELLLDYYENTDAQTRTIVPLRRTYWPA
jgi:restriction system protein